jgi:hypothetical protein
MTRRTHSATGRSPLGDVELSGVRRREGDNLTGNPFITDEPGREQQRDREFVQLISQPSAIRAFADRLVSP